MTTTVFHAMGGPTGGVGFWPRCALSLGTLWSFIVMSISFELQDSFTSCPNAINISQPENGVCYSLLIDNNCQFLRLLNCRVIEGYLDIRGDLLKDVDSLEFPDLREIRDFLLIYNVRTHLPLAKMFPNLILIRGEDLIHNYAYVIVDSPNVTSSYLPSLRLIRGLDYDGNSMDACGKQPSQNWKDVWLEGKSKYFSNNLYSGTHLQTQTETQGSDRFNSQDSDRITGNRSVSKSTGRCHPQCLEGCSSENDDSTCTACKYFREEGVCVPNCSESKVIFGHSCVTKEFCSSNKFVFSYDLKECLYYRIQDNKEKRPTGTCPLAHKIQKDKCLPCEKGDYCSTDDPCHDRTIRTVDDSLTLANCVNLTGNLVIQVLGVAFVERELEKNLGKIREVEGCVRLSNMSLRSVNFLKSLLVIHGLLCPNRPALHIEGNPNLSDLDAWISSGLQIKTGDIWINKNPKLCLNHIDKFQERLKIGPRLTKKGNGYAQCCHKELSFNLTASTKVGTLNIIFLPIQKESELPSTVSSTQSTSLQKEHAKPHRSFIITYKKTNSEIFSEDKSDTCVKGWKVKSLELTDEIASPHYELTNLLPFTRYAVVVTEMNAGKIESKSKAMYALTNVYKPSSPRSVIITSKNSSTLDVRWSPPLHPNGDNLSFVVSIQLMHMDFDAKDLDVCKSKDLERLHKPQKKDNLEGNRKLQKKHNLEGNFPKESMMTFPGLRHDGGKNKRPSSSCGQSADDDESENEYFRLDRSNEGEGGEWFTEYSPVTLGSYKMLNCHPDKTSCPDGYIQRKNISTSFTKYSFSNLLHGGMYKISVVACQDVSVNCPKEFPNKCRLCSLPEVEIGNVLPKALADRVDKSTFQYEVIEAPKRGISIKFEVPQNPNSKILGFELFFFDSVKGTLESSKCVKIPTLFPPRNVSVFYDDLPYGNLSLSIRTLTKTDSDINDYGFLFCPFNKKEDYNYLIVTIPSLLIVYVAVYCIYSKFVKKPPEPVIVNARDTIVDKGLMEKVDASKISKIPLEEITLEKKIGYGYFGEVWEGKWLGEKETAVAIKKCIAGKLNNSPEKFLKEAILLNQLKDHNNIVTISGIVADEKHQILFIVMEYLENGDLKDYLIKNKKNYDGPQMKLWAIQICEGLSFLAREKIVHIDLAARNILLDHDLNAKISDFGLALKVEVEKRECVVELPTTKWMAPECFEPKHCFSEKSDVWSYGVVLLEILTNGEEPKKFVTIGHAQEILKDLKEADSETARQFRHIMAECWKFEPLQRYNFRLLQKKWKNPCGSLDISNLTPLVSYQDEAHEERDSGFVRENSSFELTNNQDADGQRSTSNDCQCDKFTSHTFHRGTSRSPVFDETKFKSCGSPRTTELTSPNGYCNPEKLSLKRKQPHKKTEVSLTLSIDPDYRSSTVSSPIPDYENLLPKHNFNNQSFPSDLSPLHRMKAQVKNIYLLHFVNKTFRKYGNKDSHFHSPDGEGLLSPPTSPT